MCGIALLLRGGSGGSAAELRAMTDLVQHRGPDGSGFLYLDRTLSPCSPGDAWRVGLGHRRLSILDLSAAGAQPMAYRDRLWVTYNGEIYNYVELRADLEALGHAFRSTSDTDVLLAAYDEWGIDAFRRLRGMWGLAIVDARRRKIVLSRDRLGIKPLYVARHRELLAVVSEIKQLRAIDGLELRPRDDAVATYLATGYQDTARSFFEGVDPLPAGTVVEVDLDSGALSAPIPYWSPERITPVVADPDEAARELRRVLSRSVEVHLRSDVPVGCALSGGLDSSAVASLVRSVGNGADLHTFTATFPGSPVDERPVVDGFVPMIDAVAHFVEPTVDGLLCDFDRFLWHHDEPVGSLSQYAGYAVARLTRAAGVPVTLNGQGGDEVLHGYWQGYFVFLQRLMRERRALALITELGGSLLPRGNAELWRQAPIMARRYLRRRRPGRLVELRPGHAAAVERGGRRALEFGALTEREWRVREIRELFLPRLLEWDDRNFMAFSVEGRYPFLDHEVIETCLSFAQPAMYSGGWTKEPLRRALADLLPPAILRRRIKLGFETPQATWLESGPLRAMLETVLRGDSGIWTYLEPGPTRASFERFRSSDRDDELGQALVRALIVDRWLRIGGPPAS
jgi:asparagine synthase (glutamine-hydrolysing)